VSVPDIAFLIAAWTFTLIAYIVGLYQGRRDGLGEAVRRLRQAKVDLTPLWQAEHRADMTRYLRPRYRTVHWNELPKFLRRDALEQDWRARR
jgi:hypothetical protein